MKSTIKVVSTIILIAGLANVVRAEPVDDNRRPLYVVKLSKYHWNDATLGARRITARNRPMEITIGVIGLNSTYKSGIITTSLMALAIQ